MQTVNELLDQLKTARGITSDYKLSLYLGVVQGAVQHWRHGRSLPDSKTVYRIASELGLDADILVLQIETQRASTDEAKAVWSRIAQRLQAGMVNAAVLMALAIVSIAGYAPNAEATALNTSKATSSSMYIMFSYLQALFRALRRAGRATLVHFVQGINHVQSADTDAAYPHAA